MNEEDSQYNKDINRFGYICLECGNIEEFKQYWNVVKNVSCNIDSGIIESCDIEYLNNLHPQIIEVECCKCGGMASICKNGIVQEIHEHDEHIRCLS